jgi:hypothetical protein
LFTNENYLLGSDVLGASDASDYKTNPIGPLSPQQLADLDRALKPDEYAAVSAFQSKEADAQAVAEHAKPLAPGEHAATVSFESSQQGTQLSSPSKPPTPMVLPTFVSRGTRPIAPRTTVAPAGVATAAVQTAADDPWWYPVLAVVGVLAVGGATLYVTRRRG